MANPVIVDGRNMLSAGRRAGAPGFVYEGIGRT